MRSVFFDPLYPKHQISLERRLNELGHKEGLSILSGSSRVLYGTARIISSVVSTFFYAFQFLIAKTLVAQIFVKASLLNCKFGFFNIVKGLLECFSLGDMMDSYATLDGKLFIVLLNADQKMPIDV